MKKITFVSLCALAMVFTACSTYQYGARHADINRQAITATPTVVDVKPDFNKRVNVTSTWQRTKQDAMAECQYMAIMNNKIDIVVDPIYKIEFRPTRMKKWKAELVGFAGYYVNPRTQYEDIKELQKFSREDIEKYLILHDSEVLKYLNAKGEVVNIYHNNCPPKKADKASAPKPEPEADPVQTTTYKKKK